uniref:Alpha-type protein kinase domain-containing protein n=1 Tax=Panagrellus redivivus TaxID=6233 RepID=A0A7E4VV88_PANRE
MNEGYAICEIMTTCCGALAKVADVVAEVRTCCGCCGGEIGDSIGAEAIDDGTVEDDVKQLLTIALFDTESYRRIRELPRFLVTETDPDKTEAYTDQQAENYHNKIMATTKSRTKTIRYGFDNGRFGSYNTWQKTAFSTDLNSWVDKGNTKIHSFSIKDGLFVPKDKDEGIVNCLTAIADLYGVMLVDCPKEYVDAVEAQGH